MSPNASVGGSPSAGPDCCARVGGAALSVAEEESQGKASGRPRHTGAGCGRAQRRWRTPSCSAVLALLMLMKAGVILASVTTEREHLLQLPTPLSKSVHHHHYHHGHGTNSLKEASPGKTAPEHHRFRHSGGMDVSCSKCPPGWGVIARCHPKSRGDPSSEGDAQWDTACAPCPPGFHSPHHSATARCWPCSRCGPGLFESHPCTPKSDTVCDSCLTGRARPLGADFDRKCLFGRASGDVRWLSEEDEDAGMPKRVQRMTAGTSAAFRLSGQLRPRGEGGGEEEKGSEGEREEVGEERRKVQQRSRAERNETSEFEGEEQESENGRSAGITWGVVTIAAFQFCVFAAAALAVCHYLRKMHSCLAEDRERTAQEINPLMEVTPIH